MTLRLRVQLMTGWAIVLGALAPAAHSQSGGGYVVRRSTTTGGAAPIVGGGYPPAFPGAFASEAILPRQAYDLPSAQGLIGLESLDAVTPFLDLV